MQGINGSTPVQLETTRNAIWCMSSTKVLTCINQVRVEREGCSVDIIQTLFVAPWFAAQLLTVFELFERVRIALSGL